MLRIRFDAWYGSAPAQDSGTSIGADEPHVAAPISTLLCAVLAKWHPLHRNAELIAMKHLLPCEAHEYVQSHPDVLFVDCRSDAEYFFVGHALGAMHVAWYDAPDWDFNPDFVADVKKLAGHSLDRPVVLICRSGKRSVEAGEVLEQAGFKAVSNVLHGFEGDLNAERQRGKINGWRRDGLPWEQF